MKRMSYIFAVLAILGVWSCSELDPLTKPTADTGSLSFARYHAIGNSLTAGFQSGGLVTAFQKASYPAMINQAASGGAFEMPLISEPGIPHLFFVRSFVGPVIDTLAGVGMPTNTTFPGVYNNLGIPGATLNEIRTQGATGANDMFDVVLRSPVSAVNQALSAGPTLTTVWAGNNDILGSALVGTDLLLTPVASFLADYQAMMDALAAGSGAVVAANIPDVVSIPFFTTLPPVVVNAERMPVLDSLGAFIPLIGPSGNLALTDLVTLGASSFLGQGIGMPPPFGTGAPLPGAVILNGAELTAIRTRTGEFNAIIDSVCANRGIPVVDFFTIFTNIAANGVMISGEEYARDFITGGLFSLDGIHPTALGYWIVATEFIKVMNANFGASIPEPKLPKGPLRAADPADPSFSPTLLPAQTLTPAHWRATWEALGVRPEDMPRP